MICLIEYLVLVQILLSGSQSAADMTLGFIHIQYLPRLLCQRRIHLGQPLRHVLMYRAFANAEGLGSLPHRGVVVDDIVGYPYSSFFNIVFQRKTPQDTFLQFMKVSEGLCILTIKPLFDNYFVSKYNSCTLQVSILNIREGFFVKESKLRLRSAGLLSVAAGFMLFLYAPLEIYFNNKYEFWFDFYDLIPLCLLMFAVFTGVSFLLAFIVSKINTRLYHGFLTVYLIAFLCTYIQGNFMIGNLPHLDGSTVDWAQYSGLRIGSVALWVAVTVLVILAVKKLSLTDYGKLTFEKPDYDTFDCLRACIKAVTIGGNLPAAVNGANEEAVAAFLDGRIDFLDIGRIVMNVCENTPRKEIKCVEDVLEADRKARERAKELIGA